MAADSGMIPTGESGPSETVVLSSMDEMGHQEWEDRHGKICYVPLVSRPDHASVPVSRLRTRVSLIVSLAANKRVDADLPHQPARHHR
jgi:hypothetical protein